MKPVDNIDLSVCRVFDIDPAILNRRTREGRLTMARFVGMHIRESMGATREEICEHYDRQRSAIRNGINTVQHMLDHDRIFRAKYDLCLQIINAKKAPYSGDLVRHGAKVWTRADSSGKVIEGRITAVLDNHFIVGSFEDPGYMSVNWIRDGRLAVKFETSRDILWIETP